MKRESLTDALRETLALFAESGTPQTTSEIAERLDLGRRATYGRLERLVERGMLETKKVGANARVWWRPATVADGATRPATAADTAPPDGEAAESLIGVLDDVEVGVFVLDENFDVAWINRATERYFGLDRERVLGRDKRTLVDEEIEPVVEDPPAFAETVRSTYDDNTDAERFECRVAPGESREGRWLEHRSKPIESGEYAGGRVELYYDVTARKRSERARNQERREFASLVEAVEEYAIFTLDPEGNVRTWNPGAERIKGYETEEIVGEHFSAFYTEDASEEGVPEENLAAAAEEGSVEDEGWRRRKDGSRFWANVTITAIRGDDGEIEGFANVIRDMSDRRKRERQLRRERDLNDRLFETAPVRLAVFDADGNVERLNTRGRRDIGDEESAGEFLESVTLLDPDGDPIPPDETPVARAFKDGEFVSDTVVRHATDDGEMPWTSLTASPIFDDDGNVDRVVVAGMDLTELKEKERRLERRRDELKSELRDVFSRVDDAFFALDGEMRFNYVNDRAEELLGFSETELLGRNIWNVLSVEEDDPARERFRTAMVSQQPTTFERYSDLLGIWAAIRVYPSESGLSVYFTDITERKERERELEEHRRWTRALIENFPNGGVAVVDDDLRYVTFGGTPSGVDVARSDLEGAHLPEVLTPELADIVVPRYEAALDGEPSEFEESIAGRDYQYHFVPVRDDDGDVFAAIGMSQEITERKERERELEEYRRETRTLIENYPAGAVALVDENLRYLTFGGTPEGDVDATRDDLEGGLVDEILPDRLADVVLPGYEGALDGEPSEFEEPIDDRVYQFHFVPVRDDDGDVFAAIGMSQDVTERKERERELQEAKLQLESATEAGAVGTWEWRIPENRVVAGPSFARTFGVDPDAARQGVPIERFLSAIHEEDRERVERKIDEALSSGGEYEAEYRVENVDGEYRWVMVRGQVEYEDGEPVTFPGALTDITDRKEAEIELKQQRQRLAALNNLHGVVRDITDAVIDKSSREEIERTVCERLADSDSYRFAWIGDVDVGTQTVNLRTEAGVEGFLDGITISVDPDDERSQGPTGRALRTGEIQTTQDVRDDESHEPWRDHVEAYGFRSSAAIPIVHEETTYGVLNVYADRPHAFEGQERTVIKKLGEVVGHAIAAAERERALLSDEVVELQFHVRDVLEERGVDEAAAPIEFDHAVPLGDGEYIAFGTAPPEAVPTVEAMAEASPYWEGVAFGEGEGEGRTAFEVRVTDSPLFSALSAHGGTFVAASIEGGDIDITLHVPAAAEVRTVIDAVREVYPNATLQRRTQTTRRRATAESDGSGLLSGLTDRQRATLETAYYSGFFEWPRGTTGEEVAEAIGVAPPTFHQHLRKAERRVFDGIFSSAT